MTHSIVKDADTRMGKAVDNIQSELGKIRTGKASTALLDTVRVDYYGTSMPLKQLATLSTPEVRLISIQPFDKNAVGPIEKAIMAADLGLNPQNDGTLIRVPIPSLNEERRQELVRLCRKLAEEGRIAVRNVRRDANEKLKKAKKDGELSEDLEKKLEKEMQRLTDSHVGKVDEILKHKEEEIMEV